MELFLVEFHITLLSSLQQGYEGLGHGHYDQA